MAKTIYYIPLVTGARTEYRKVSAEDSTYLLNQMMRGLVKMATLSNTTNDDYKELRDIWWRKRRKTLPKGRDGQNSPESFIAGVLDNMLYATNQQRDVTAVQCEALEDIFNWLTAFDSGIEAIRFQIKVI